LGGTAWRIHTTLRGQHSSKTPRLLKGVQTRTSKEKKTTELSSNFKSALEKEKKPHEQKKKEGIRSPTNPGK